MACGEKMFGVDCRPSHFLGGLKGTASPTLPFPWIKFSILSHSHPISRTCDTSSFSSMTLVPLQPVQKQIEFDLPIFLWMAAMSR